MTDVHDQSNFPRPGRHRSADDRDADLRDAPADDYDDDFREDDREGRPADTGGGMPLRGLAMICIFIGVCLMGWGLYAWTSGNDGDGGGDGGSGNGGSVAEAPADGAGDRPAGEQPAVSDGGAGNGADGRPDAEAPAPPAREGENADAAQGADGEIRRADFRVTVLNNSPEPGLAAGVSDSLSGEGWGRGETGNAPEGEYGVWQRTTVHYTEGNAAEKAAAEEIARDNGWVAEPRRPELRDAPAGLIVVTAVDARS